jgi:hypothetical protein
LEEQAAIIAACGAPAAPELMTVAFSRNSAVADERCFSSPAIAVPA